jgi:hypothetical protein
MNAVLGAVLVILRCGDILLIYSSVVPCNNTYYHNCMYIYIFIYILITSTFHAYLRFCMCVVVWSELLTTLSGW